MCCFFVVRMVCVCVWVWMRRLDCFLSIKYVKFKNWFLTFVPFAAYFRCLAAFENIFFSYSRNDCVCLNKSKNSPLTTLFDHHHHHHHIFCIEWKLWARAWRKWRRCGISFFILFNYFCPDFFFFFLDIRSSLMEFYQCDSNGIFAVLAHGASVDSLTHFNWR